MELPAAREGEAPPLPGVVVVRLPIGFYSTPAPALPGLHSMPVADWTGAYGTIDTAEVKQIFHQTIGYFGGLLEKVPPIFPPL